MAASLKVWDEAGNLQLDSSTYTTRLLGVLVLNNDILPTQLSVPIAGKQQRFWFQVHDSVSLYVEEKNGGLEVSTVNYGSGNSYPAPLYFYYGVC